MWDDWELYPSDFFDEDSPRKRKRGADVRGGLSKNANGAQCSKSRNRQKLESTDAIPKLSLGDPAIPKVVWRSPAHDPPTLPIVEDGKAEKIALLKDWRERFKGSTGDALTQLPHRNSQTAFAVVVPRRQSPTKETDRERMPPPVGSKSPKLPSRDKSNESLKGTEGSASSTAKPRHNSILAANGGRNVAAGRPPLTHKGDQAATKGRKRKAPEPDHVEGDDEVTNGEPLKLGLEAPSQGRKRKAAANPEPEGQRPRAKRVASARGGVSAASKAGSTSQEARPAARKSARNKK